MTHYSKGFYLKGARGNNAFAFERRGSEPSLYIPPVKEGPMDSVELGPHIVFADEDEHGVLRECTGLGTLLKTSWKGVPLVLVDNHNHVFYFWMEAYLQGLLGDGATLIHVDQHKDMREPPALFEGKTLEDAFAYTNEVLNVGNYIVPAMKAGVVKEVHLVTSELAMEDRSYLGKRPKILNVDLDFFAPEMDYIDFEKAKKFVLDHAEEATLITVATSPFFIDQALALKVFQRLFG